MSTKINQSSKLVLFFFLVVLISCNREGSKTIESIIPKPQEATSTGEDFLLKETTGIFVESGSKDELEIANYLANKLRSATGFKIPISSTSKPEAGSIVIAKAQGEEISGEGYELTVSEDMVRLSSATSAGVFRGVQTIRQLLPASIESSSLQSNVEWTIPTGTIKDYPNYKWRGMMLDVSRHFFTVDDIKRLLDQMAYYKLNVFHWHLSDDQGWRIEIKSWPKLTTFGGSTQVGGGKGGFYTQEQYKDVVKYAQERYITVVPEIDMPGHTNAALASYPELNCSEQTIKLSPGNEVKKTVPGLYTGIEVGFSTICATKESTYKFVDDVVRELAEMTPGPYIHIGGDESHATKKEDYIPFVKRVQEIVIKHGKKVVGWDEVAISTLVPETMAQVWARAENGKLAIAQGGKLIMSPARKAYLDMSYDSTTKLGLHWAAYIEVDSAYAWDPSTLEKGISRENIYGVESALWTETIQTRSDIDYMVFPRLPGYAEIGWSATPDGKPGSRNWDEYKVRLASHGPRMKAMGINFYQSKLVPWKE
ncbi:MAG TPA: beta-N-acetylhexosaminidase [Cyclobacteriaceae bacterium]|jgi:hexosaminidase|nr:beta-N-acetylhexosaminidase [Cyclobacteriaceae bacterium]